MFTDTDVGNANDAVGGPRSQIWLSYGEPVRIKPQMCTTIKIADDYTGTLVLLEFLAEVVGRGGNSDNRRRRKQEQEREESMITHGC